MDRSLATERARRTATTLDGPIDELADLAVFYDRPEASPDALRLYVHAIASCVQAEAACRHLGLDLEGPS